ncbi:MAG TPA: hypothetical protein PKL15_06505 [Saprospiraceae bacterium]|nr:hypothetical protein [Saprospiraceae bacterium]
MKASKRLTLFVSYTVLIIWSLVLFFPIYWVVIASFKSQVVFAVKSRYLPFVDFQPTLQAWRP